MNTFWWILISILLAAIGIFMVAAPEIMWKLDHFLTVKNGEPSDFYLASTRIGGTLMIIIAIILFLCSILGMFS